MIPPFIRATKEGVVLTVHVQPKASYTACIGVQGDAVKIRVAAPPVGGAANAELIRFLADTCSIPRAAIAIESGSGARHKRVGLRGVSASLVMARLLQKGPVTT